ncbi:hypothetical protein FPQ18DRAFT_374743 [Pyronema domesticum]|nr:hypothetical protein FPQ18DRAFT_374743 [Pyronema domesticum]
MALEAISVASSITALLHTGSAAISFITLMKESSTTMRKTAAELKEWNILFRRLQGLINKLDTSDQMGDRREMVKLEDLVVTLTECLAAYNELASIIFRIESADNSDRSLRLQALQHSFGLASKDREIS